VRKIYSLTVAFLFAAVLFVLFFPVLAVFPTYRWRTTVSRVYARWWAKCVLWAIRVRLVVNGAEHLRTLPAVLTFNHVNTLDFFINAAFAPPHCLVFGKRELVKVPFVGWMWAVGGHPMIRRKDRSQWAGLMDGIAARLATGRHSTFISPEGTRSRDGKLLPFKKGPFHLAIQSGAAIVPCVLRGCGDCYQPDGTPVPGTVTVDVLAPIATDQWRAETIDEHVAEVRQLYLEALGEAERAREPEPAPEVVSASA